MGNNLFIARSGAGTITSNAVIFDEILLNEGNITYVPATGVITLNQKGVYHINWWVITQSAVNSTNAGFSLVTSSGAVVIGNSPLKTGQISGVADIKVTAPPITMTLRNANIGSTVYLSSTVPVKAMMSVNMAAEAGTEDTMLSFEYRQLQNILNQVITYYPENTIRVYSPGFYDIDGLSVSLYASPEGNGAGILNMSFEGDRESVVFNTIMAFRIGADSVYNPDITYLTPPSPLPEGWDNNIITAVHDFLPVGTAVEIYWGIGNNRTGLVFKNEYGMLVVAADMDGNDPTFILPTSSLIILQPEPSAKKASGKITLKKIDF